MPSNDPTGALPSYAIVTYIMKDDTRIYASGDSTYVWLPMLYTFYEHALMGVSIVAKVNLAPNHPVGDYGAYIGVCNGDLDNLKAAQSIAASGEKIAGPLAEKLFREIIDRLHPDRQILWRR
jgi:hypothetical protein